MIFFSISLSAIVVVLLSLGFYTHLTTFQKLRKADLFFEDTIVYDCNYFREHPFSDSLNNRLPDYIFISEKQGIQAVEHEEHLKKLYQCNELVCVENKTGFILDTFVFSFPYLTPHAKETLDTVGVRFKKAIKESPLKGSKLIITSLTRTKATVAKLVRFNRSAVKKSPHLNGNSFDISFSKFQTDHGLDYCERIYLQEMVSKILYDLRREKKCWVTFERRNQCLHVVARK